jgi:hypothetical protein
MRIRIIRATVCGGVAVNVGEIVDASERDARVLLALNKAETAITEAAPVDAVEDAPKRRGRPAKAAE